MFGRRGFGRRRRSGVFGCGWHLVHRTVVHAPGDPLQSRNLNTGRGGGPMGEKHRRLPAQMGWSPAGKSEPR